MFSRIKRWHEGKKMHYQTMASGCSWTTASFLFPMPSSRGSNKPQLSKSPRLNGNLLLIFIGPCLMLTLQLNLSAIQLRSH
ncbi:hypothetical protein GCD22_02908 [Acidithiobacillus thiooxidans ATCC 19377]|uniref:Uncharacterized protein n=1 Tax=Acidithiobacillus thiooxidans ATCC 19377 TaxID=637390 RepID=A0A5P9XSJ1_ACITH|nr:hypothetical protein GCD22_02908 [Acidithiobacillus thiooxidans ATCC 19377]